MKNKITKWVLEDIEINGKFLSKPYKHYNEMVDLDDEDIMFLPTRQIARDYAKGFEGLTPRKVLIILDK